MKYLILSTTLLASPAFALQTPVPGKDDHHVCTAVYDPNNVLDVQAVGGHTIAIRFGEKERIATDGTGHVTLSDSAHMKMAVAEGSNVLWLKPTMKMETQPILIRTLKEDGKPRDYVIQWTASAPPREPSANAQLASTGPVSITEVPAALPGPNICYQITYVYPVDAANDKRAASAALWAKRQAQAAEVALHTPTQAGRNVRYTAQGDGSIGPAEVFDDGMTTTLSFPGNLSVPVIYRINPDGSDGATIGITTEQGGVVKLHEVLPRFRLRQGDLVLCVFNQSFSPLGNNPGTGTTSDAITRGVHQ